jgi:N-hydroxyarylamine O-acetyltransferase
VRPSDEVFVQTSESLNRGKQMAFDLDAYLARIDFDGPREPTLGVLRALHRLHPAAVPFDNLDPLLGRPVPLDLGALQAKLVGARRGGYCFEQNALFRAALTALGFAVTPLIARVVWMAPPEAPLGPRNHMLLKVDLPEGPYLADVGFGGHLFSAPLKLAPGLEQATAESVLRLAPAGEALVLETRLPAGWVSLYRFTLEPAEESDYEVSNWHTSTHPAHLLTNNLLAERLTPKVRSSLLNTRLIRRYPDGRTEIVELTSPGALARALEEDFGLPPQDDIEGLFARLPRG